MLKQNKFVLFSGTPCQVAGLRKFLGKSYDNFNEAYISKEYPIISAQWHPEKTLDEEPSKIIFDYFKNLVLNNKK